MYRKNKNPFHGENRTDGYVLGPTDKVPLELEGWFGQAGNWARLEGT